MRTTITLESDVVKSIKVATSRHGLTVKQVVNDVLRRGFAFEQKELQRSKRTVELITFNRGLKPEYQNVNFNYLDTELEDEHILEKLKL